MEKKLTKGMLMTALICGTISMVPFGAVAHAEDAAADDAALQGFNLEQIVVTATRTENKLIDTAANVAIVTAEDIEKHNYQSAADALKDVPGVSVLHNGGEQEFRLRLIERARACRYTGERHLMRHRSQFCPYILQEFYQHRVPDP